MNKRCNGRRFTLLVNEAAVKKDREDAKRRAELQKFIKACEMLYEKNRAQQDI